MGPDSHAWNYWFAVRKAAAVMEREAQIVISASTGTSFAQFMVLSVIDAHPVPLIQTAIAEHLGLTKATVSRLIDVGARAGWIDVAPDPASRRSRLISLTDAGTALVRTGDAALAESRLASPDATAAAIGAATATLVRTTDALHAAPSA
jgi:DNA-binding MarR family transcriptional regulator